MERWNPTPKEIAEVREKVAMLSTNKLLTKEDKRLLSDVSVLLLRLYEATAARPKAECE
jgi:hypothetical protein